jgi:hypothetical protein
MTLHTFDVIRKHILSLIKDIIPANNDVIDIMIPSINVIVRIASEYIDSNNDNDNANNIIEKLINKNPSNLKLYNCCVL